MPRLNHKKAKTGCQRCKSRKVKCDEAKPRCSACARHNVPCVYAHAPSPKKAEQHTPPNPLTPPTDIPYNAQFQENVQDRNSDPLLELRLMHEWTAYCCKTFSSAWEFWCYQAPLIALEFRIVMDAMLGLAALYASRQPQFQWIPIEGRMVPIRSPIYNPAHPERELSASWRDADKEVIARAVKNADNDAYLATKRSYEMLTISRIYFDRAIDGHRKALATLTVENIEAVYITSILVSFIALFTLSEDEEDTTLPSVDPRQWLRLGRGTSFICNRWQQMVGQQWMASSGAFYGKPDLSDAEYLFRFEHNRPFERLLTWGEDFEAMSAEDRECYQKTLSYIGLIYKGIVEGTDSPLVSCRRLIAIPSRCPHRFVDLAEAKQPRAMAMLAHAFATMKLIDDTTTKWFKGIAERQIPRIYQEMPPAWKEMMVWPMAVANGESDREPRETQIDDILSL